MSEETLSDKINGSDIGLVIKLEDVREFIKKLTDKMGNCHSGLDEKGLKIFYYWCNKLAGDKLI